MSIDQARADGSLNEASDAKPAPLWRKVLPILLTVAGVALAAYLISLGLRRYTLDDIVASVRAIPAMNLAAAAACAAGSYGCLTLFDYLGLRYAGKPLPYRQAALTSFTSLSLGHNIGFAGISSGAIRYRFYARAGLSVGEVAKVVIFCGVTVAMGLLTLGAAALLLRPETAARATGLDVAAMRLIGGACALAVVAYPIASHFVDGALRIKGWTLALPSARVALMQIGAGLANYLFVAGCLFALIAPATGEGYLATATAFVTGTLLSLLMHVPGGLGVIEFTVIHVFDGKDVIGGLIVFRAVYFFVPLALGLVAFAASELVRGSHDRRKGQAER